MGRGVFVDNEPSLVEETGHNPLPSCYAQRLRNHLGIDWSTQEIDRPFFETSVSEISESADSLSPYFVQLTAYEQNSDNAFCHQAPPRRCSSRRCSRLVVSNSETISPIFDQSPRKTIAGVTIQSI